ncbi:metallophosphoesterase family protein [Bacillus sp. T33-2]|uniref:metallophosphoesterase family protein n=1 Tax=Bacillus sp. T33-2 TaxID=2054168 RepID=UPI000C75D06D|nr:DNA repair exonuclease [Bacillus sp. T33-2]PLR89948.1 DNA repair exonuclease [Bacillus sp. T33-2]
MGQVTFLHTADLHLDSPMVGLKNLPGHIFKRLQESTFKALENITEAAIRHQVDFVIIAGDIFDGEDRSLRAQARFKREMDRLCDNGIPVYVIHGNHDHLGGSWAQMKYPGNVHVFRDKVEVKTVKTGAGSTVHLYGFSYPERHVTGRWIERYEKKEGADYHIGILHGNADGAKEHGNYAPFGVADLAARQFDYWALGHIHKRSVISTEPPALYPGNPQGRNKKESGEKGCYLVGLTEAGASVNFVETADVIWRDVKIDGSSVSAFHDLYQLCKTAVEAARIEGKGVLLSLQIENMNLAQSSLLAHSGPAELLDILQEEENDEESFVWLFNLSYTEAYTATREQLMAQGDFFEEMFAAIDGYQEAGQALSPLFNHHSARRYLERITEEEEQMLLSDAEKLLLKLLLKNKMLGKEETV